MTFHVRGTPAPQGSKRHVGNGIMVESSKAVKPWREAVKWAAIEALAGRPPLDGPVSVNIIFHLPRPKSLPWRVTQHTKRPDLDKLTRSTYDALKQAGVYRDDSQVCQSTQSKLYTTDTPGATIMVEDCAMREAVLCGLGGAA